MGRQNHWRVNLNYEQLEYYTFHAVFVVIIHSHHFIRPIHRVEHLRFTRKMCNSFFKLTLFVFQALCLSELTVGIVLARPQPLGATLSRSSDRSFGRRSARKLVEKDAVPTFDEVVVTAATTKGQTKLNQEVTLNAFDLCLCGAFATAFGDFVMHPVDTIKVTQQAATLAVDIITTAKNIFAKGGVMGFYPGVLPYMTADGLSGAIKFASFEVSKVFLEKRLPLNFHPAIQFVCAGAAMIACSFVMVPGEVIKTRMQAGKQFTTYIILTHILYPLLTHIPLLFSAILC